jgi:hypothetical protein
MGLTAGFTVRENEHAADCGQQNYEPAFPREHADYLVVKAKAAGASGYADIIL